MEPATAMNQATDNLPLTPEQEDRIDQASALYSAEKFAEARAVVDGLLAEAPRDYSVLHLAGVIATGENKLADAAELLKTALQRAPDPERTAVSWYALGRALRKAGDLRQAEEAMRRAIHFNPRACNFLLELIEIYMLGWKMDLALETAKTAVNRFFNDPTPYNALGNVLHKCGRFEEARMAFELAIKRMPEYAPSHMSLGSTLKVLGRFKEAEVEMREALRLDPMIRGWMELTQIRKDPATEQEIAVIKRRLDPAVNASVMSRVDALFALASLADDDGNFAQAFKYYDEAWRTYRPSLEYSIVEHEHMQEGIAALFTPDFIARYEHMSKSELAPIFILGMPRSGTTLTEQIIASHSKVQPGNELFFMTMISRDLGTLWESRGDAAPGDDATVADDLNKAAQRYADYTADLWKDSPHITDKMPMNFFYVGIIHFLFPKAKIIYTKRNPPANCFSCMENLFGHGNLQFSYDQVEMGKYYKLHERMMAHWNKVLPGRVLTVQYEELVQDHEKQVKRILEFCGLDFEPACLEFHTLKRAVPTASFAQVRKPIYTSSLDHWKNYEPYLGPLLETLGMKSTQADPA